MKYICAILFLGANVFFIFLNFKNCFSIDNHCKRWNVFSDFLKITRIFWTLLRVLKKPGSVIQDALAVGEFAGEAVLSTSHSKFSMRSSIFGRGIIWT